MKLYSVIIISKIMKSQVQERYKTYKRNNKAKDKTSKLIVLNPGGDEISCLPYATEALKVSFIINVLGAGLEAGFASLINHSSAFH